MNVKVLTHEHYENKLGFKNDLLVLRRVRRVIQNQLIFLPVSSSKAVSVNFEY